MVSYSIITRLYKVALLLVRSCAADDDREGGFALYCNVTCLHSEGDARFRGKRGPCRGRVLSGVCTVSHITVGDTSTGTQRDYITIERLS